MIDVGGDHRQWNPKLAFTNRIRERITNERGRGNLGGSAPFGHAKPAQDKVGV